MLTQVEQGNEVALLWPGRITKFNGKTKIRKKKDWKGIENLELINPLPVSLDEGILNIDAYTKSTDKTVYLNFLENYLPNVIHVHTLMGLHKEFMQAANQLGIRTVFTTHDYFGICPKVILYHDGDVCDEDHGCSDCVNCNQSALSLKKIIVMQSMLYRNLKDTKVVKILRRQHRQKFFEDSVSKIAELKDSQNTAQDYKKLREYYISILETIDFIHFNSSLAENIYKKYMTPKDSKMVSITHSDIKDNRNNVHINSSKLRILYLAPPKPYKGYNVLIQALDELWESGFTNFILKVFSPVKKMTDYMVVQDMGYNYNDLPIIFSNADVLVAPSIWYETFGFTVLEALSFGVPVIVSDHVGAKDIIGNSGEIVKAGNVHELKSVIKNFHYKKSNEPVKKWEDFVKENYLLYKK